MAAVHNIAAIASGIARSGADIIAIDGFRGGTGAAPTRIRDNVGIPVELALAAVDQRLRDEGIRNHVSLVAGGSIRSASDVVKAVALERTPVMLQQPRFWLLGVISAARVKAASVTGGSPRRILNLWKDLIRRREAVGLSI